jgi:hypothetical protein
MDPNVVSVDTVTDTYGPGWESHVRAEAALRLANRPKLMIAIATRGKVTPLTV